MRRTSKKPDGSIGLLRGIARLIGWAASAFFLLFLIGEGLTGASRPLALDGRLLAFLPLVLLAVAGCVVAVFKARAGGLMQAAGGLMMGVFHLVNGGAKDADMALVFGLPYVVGGLLLFLCSPQDRENAHAQ